LTTPTCANQRWLRNDRHGGDYGCWTHPVAGVHNRTTDIEERGRDLAILVHAAGIFADGKLKRADVPAAAVQTLATAPAGPPFTACLVNQGGKTEILVEMTP